MGYAEQFRSIALHKVVRIEVVGARLVLLLAEHHLRLQVWWWLDLVFALYLLFVFKSMLNQLLLLGLWTSGRAFALQSSYLGWELAMVEISLLCCLAFKDIEDSLLETAQMVNPSRIGSIDLEPSYILPADETECNQVEEANHWTEFGQFVFLVARS